MPCVTNWLLMARPKSQQEARVQTASWNKTRWWLKWTAQNIEQSSASDRRTARLATG